jgi:uncharacterized membrane-anchored protein
MPTKKLGLNFCLNKKTRIVYVKDPVFTDEEALVMNEFDALGYVKDYPAKSLEAVNSMFEKFNYLFKKDNINKAQIVELMAEFIPNFEHIEKGKNLDQRM